VEFGGLYEHGDGVIVLLLVFYLLVLYFSEVKMADFLEKVLGME
jgi:hypothetical protein